MRLALNRHRIHARLLDLAFHRVAKLRVYLISDRHHLREEHGKVDGVIILLKCVEDTDLENPGFLDHHGSGIAEAPSRPTMLRCRHR
jgi:hypothetical protein